MTSSRPDDAPDTATLTGDPACGDPACGDAMREGDQRWRSLARVVEGALPAMLRDLLAADHPDYAASS